MTKMRLIMKLSWAFACSAVYWYRELWHMVIDVLQRQEISVVSTLTTGFVCTH